LLYYGSDEPGEIIIHLLNELKIELLQQDPQTKSAGELTRQLQLNAPATENELITELYKTNGGLFNHLSTGKNFIKMIYENEPA
jgi:hypothetical protein